MVQHFLPFQNVTVAVFQVFLYFLYLLAIPDSEIRKKNHEEELKQTRKDRPIFKKKVGNYEKCEFSNFFLFQHYYTAGLVLQPLKHYGLIIFFTLSSRISCSFLRNCNNFWLFASTLN